MPRRATPAPPPPAPKKKGRPKRKPGENLTVANKARYAEIATFRPTADTVSAKANLDVKFWFGTDKEIQVHATSGYSRALAAKICGYLAQGMGLKKICTPGTSPLSEDERPWYSAVSRWRFEFDEFERAIVRAAQMAADALAAEVVEIADSGSAVVPTYKRDPLTGLQVNDANGQPIIEHRLRTLDSDVIQHNKIRIEARKWYAAKLNPKRYGERLTQEHTSPPDAPVLIGNGNLRGLNDAELAQMENLMRKAIKAGN